MDKRQHRFIVTLVFFFCFWSVFALSGEMVMHFIDVGQGDCIFIQTPCESSILVDAGWDYQGPAVVSYLQSLGVEKIDTVIASHQHADHIGGLLSVYEHFDVEVTYDSGYDHTTQMAQNYRNLAQENSEFKIARAFDTLDLSCEDTVITFIHPYQGAEGNIHYMSLVVNVQYRDFSALLTGDAGTAVEEVLLENPLSAAYLPSQVLKVGHHGSYTSTGEAFLAAVSPEAAIIQCGENNPYGHPHGVVVDRLRDAQVNILRNDLLGAIVLTTDGEEYSFSYPDIPAVEIASIAELRQKVNDGETYRLTADAVITLQGANRNQRFIQDNTAAILIDDAGEIIPLDRYMQGDLIRNLTGTVTHFANMVQLNITADTAERMSSGNVIEPLTVSLSELQADHDGNRLLQGALIRVEKLNYTGSEEIFAGRSSYVFQNEMESAITLFTWFHELPYIDQSIPMSSVNITGVHGVYWNTLEITPRDTNDMEPVSSIINWNRY